MIVDAIKGKPAETAINALKFMPQKSAGIVEKNRSFRCCQRRPEHQY
jgi:hypothetical protein